MAQRNEFLVPCEIVDNLSEISHTATALFVLLCAHRDSRVIAENFSRWMAAALNCESGQYAAALEELKVRGLLDMIWR
jgi:hypothetical protein